MRKLTEKEAGSVPKFLTQAPGAIVAPESTVSPGAFTFRLE